MKGTLYGFICKSIPEGQKTGSRSKPLLRVTGAVYCLIILRGIDLETTEVSYVYFELFKDQFMSSTDRINVFV